MLVLAAMGVNIVSQLQSDKENIASLIYNLSNNFSAYFFITALVLKSYRWWDLIFHSKVNLNKKINYQILKAVVCGVFVFIFFDLAYYIVFLI